MKMFTEKRKQPLILVVDDEPDICQVLEDYLKAKGYGVLKALDGFRALRLAKKKKPDIILLDILMPKMDGFETLRLLKKDMRTMRIPVIVLTAKTLTEDVEIGMRELAEKYLAKPFDMLHVCTEIDKSLALHGKDKASFPKAA